MGRRRAHPHLLRTDAEPAALAPLIRAVESDPTPPNRVGWLVWTPDAAASDSESLAGSADAGVHSAVHVHVAGSVAIRARKGPPILADVLRVHFPGCRLVLVRGDVDELEIRPSGEDRYEIHREGIVETLDVRDLADRLRRPRPFEP